MKNLFFAFAFALALAAALPSSAATPVRLHPGSNPCPAGEVVAFEAVTVSNTAPISVKQILTVADSVPVYSNLVTDATQYSFTLTNWNGSASVSTNVLNNFSYSDWIDAGGTNHLASAVTVTTVPVTNSYLVGTTTANPFTRERTLFSASTASHILNVSTNGVYLSGAGQLTLTGATDDDLIFIFLK